MIILQKLGFRDSRYERPQDKWVCGHLKDGKPCSVGPGADGRCRATTVCRPHLEDGRWECRRSSQEGGPCEQGPLPDGTCSLRIEPCVPQSSLRAKRRRITWWAMALTIGILVLIIGAGKANDYLMPGALSQAHAVETNCQSCHSGMAKGPLGWLHSFAATVSPRQTAGLCTSCHDVGKHAFTAHTSPVEQLRKVTETFKADLKGGRAQNDSWVHTISFPLPDIKSPSGAPEIFCATCHKEHKGVFSKLTSISNDVCQSCHVSKFGSFARSHPQFGNYPFTRRTRVIFNHKSHFGTYFPKAKSEPVTGQVVPGVCSDCHVPGAGQKYMEIRSYQAMCSSCHDGDIRGANVAAGPKGIDFISVPGLDVQTLAEHGIDIGAWPAESEAGITPFMRTLLAREPGGKDVVKGVADLDLLDLTSADDATLAKVKDLAWAVKRLLKSLETNTVASAMDMPPDADHSDTQMSGLTGGISHDVIMEADRSWFPDLADDLMRHAEGKPSKSFVPPKPPDTSADQSKATQSGQNELKTGETPPSDSGLVPQSNEANSNILAPGNEAKSTDNILAPSSESKSSDILSPGNEAKSTDNILAPGNEAKSTDNILAPSSESKSSDILSPGNEAKSTDNILAPSSESKSSDILSPGSETQGTGNLLGVGSDTSSEPSTPEQPVEKPFNAEAWAKYGGWYRKDYTIRYRPTGHADMFMHTWLDFAGHAYGKDAKGQFTPIFDKLARSDSVGRCTKCHSVDNGHGAKTVNWMAFDAGAVRTRFTTFSHAPHIEMAGTKGCVFCHALTETPSGDYMKTYAKGDVSAYSQNFVPLEKSLCATCHTRKAAGENCTQCHKYHFTEFSRPLIKTKLP